MIARAIIIPLLTLSSAQSVVGSNFLAGNMLDQNGDSQSGGGLVNSLANIGLYPLQPAANILNFAPSSLFGVLNSQFSLSSGTAVGLGSVLQSVANGNISPEVASLQCVSQSVVSTSIVRQFTAITSSSFTGIFGKMFSQTQMTNIVRFQQTWVNLVKFQNMLSSQMNIVMNLQQCAAQLLIHAPQQVIRGVSQVGSNAAQLGVTVIGMPVRLGSVCIDACASVVQQQMSMQAAVLNFITTTRVTDVEVNTILSISQLSSSQAAFVPGGSAVFQQFQSTLTKVRTVQTTIVKQFGSQVSIFDVAQQLLSMSGVTAPQLPTGAPSHSTFTGPACSSCQSAVGNWNLQQDSVFNTAVLGTVVSTSVTQLQVTFQVVNSFNFVWSRTSASDIWSAKLVAQTKMAGPPATMQYESFFVSAMLSVTQVEIFSSQIKFHTSTGIAVFNRAVSGNFPTLEPFSTTVPPISPVGSYLASSSSLDLDLSLVVGQSADGLLAVVKLVNSFYLQLRQTSVLSTYSVQLVSTTQIGVTDGIAATEASLAQFLSKGCVLEVSASGVTMVNGETRIAFIEN